jgi:hypothetical protein
MHLALRQDTDKIVGGAVMREYATAAHFFCLF